MSQRAARLSYCDPVGGFSGFVTVEITCEGWLESRLGGANFGVFFFGFFASRLRLSLFPIANSMPRMANPWLGHVHCYCTFGITAIRESNPGMSVSSESSAIAA